MKVEYVEVTAPIALLPQTNFFDQPPFRVAIDSVETGSGLDIELVRRQLDFACFAFHAGRHLDIPKNWYNKPSQELCQLMSNLEHIQVVYLPRFENEASQDRLIYSYQLLAEGLRRYPHWVEYIVTQKEPGQYFPNGDKIPKINCQYSESYASWVMRRFCHLRMKDAKAVFPEYYEDGSEYSEKPTINVTDPTKNSPNPDLTWKILLEQETGCQLEDREAMEAVHISS